MIFSMEKSKKSKHKKHKNFMYHTARKDLVNFDFFGLKKFFWLSLLQNAKYCHIKTHQNLEFHGKFHGGAKKYMDLITFFRFGLEI